MKVKKINLITPEGQTVGRKFVSIIIGCLMLLLGVVVFDKLEVDFQYFDSYVLGVVALCGSYNLANVLNKRFLNGGKK